ncbi:YlzJ-like family protein [Paenibacillus jiagnxiensis]|uniref:YlzJ-like family protein n=1 Tax=Paenibacillus jiagnxiensis TaxID=3228926 RepID=UPI0033B5B60F
MTHYSIVPMELVLEGMWKEAGPLQEISAEGCLIQVRSEGERKGTIVRLLDCPLDAYLNPKLSPGNEIEW